MNLKEYTPKIIETIQRLVRIKTVEDTPVAGGPFGKGNKECLEEALKIAESLGFRTKNLDGYCGYAEIGEGDEIVGIAGHLDVVPEGEGWKYPPYSGELVDGELWGRGTWDDKGPIVISMYAIKAMKDAGFNFNKRVRIIFGCNEETGSRCMKYYVEKEGYFDYGVTPDAEFPVIFAEKAINNIKVSGTSEEHKKIKLTYLDSGIVINAVPDKCVFKLDYQEACANCQKEKPEAINNKLKANNINYEVKDDGKVLTYTVYGKAAHGSTPQKGINAASYAIDALYGIIDSDFVNFYHEFIGTDYNGRNMGCFIEDKYGPIVTNVGLVHYENSKFSIAINSRLPFNITNEVMKEKVENRLKDFNNVNFEYLGGVAGFIIDENSTMIQSLTKAYQNVTKDYASKPICCAGGTYAKEFKNCVAFGPEMEGFGDLNLHQPNERIQVRAIEALMEIYYNGYQDLVSKVSFKK